MREESKTLSIVGATVGIVCAVVVSHGCSTANAQTAKPRVDPKADAWLRKMSTTLANTAAFQVDADHVLEVMTSDGEKLQFMAKSQVTVERPNKLRSDRIGPIADLTVRYDGTHLSIYGKRKNLYATTEAPATIEETLDFARDTLGIEAPGADLIYKGAYAGLMEDVTSGRYIGLEPIGDRMCHHLAYRGNQTDWQIWVEDSDQALPCRYVITTKTLAGQPEFEVALTNWKLEPTLAPDFFAFTPPKGATEIEFLARPGEGETAARRAAGEEAVKNKTKRASLVAVAALIAIGAVTDTGPMILGGSQSEAIVGRPLTPMSYAGVARRTTRRAAYYGGAYGYGPAYAAPGYAAPAPAGYVTALPAGCVMAGGYYTCGGARYRPYYNGPTVVYRVVY